MILDSRFKKAIWIVSLGILLIVGVLVYHSQKHENIKTLKQTVNFEIPLGYAEPLVIKTFNNLFQIQPINAKNAEKQEQDSIIKYIDVYQNTDVEQTLYPNKIKESIILKSANHPEVFEYELPNLAEYDYEFKDQDLVFYQKGKKGEELYSVLTIPEPYMAESSKLQAPSSKEIPNPKSQTANSDIGKVEMTIDGNKLVLTPDMSWIANHQYPIIIDPTVEINILNIYSHPQQGENWEVSFTTQGTADLKIIPADQATVDDDEFIGLYCGETKLEPQILTGDIIDYPNWECDRVGKIIHYTLKAGKHHLLFEFGEARAEAYNDSSGPNSPGTAAVDSSSGGTADWASPDYIKVADANIAYAVVGIAGVTPCLAHNVLVATVDGDKFITDLKLGELVYSYNLVSGQIELGEVNNIISHSIIDADSQYYHIYFDGGDIRVTAGHLFYTREQYIAARDIRIGDKLLGVNGKAHRVNEIVTEENEVDRVWDLSVAGNHNFFANGVLVHNSGIYDHRVRIIKGGVIGETDLASADAWPSSYAYKTYGGAAEVWGESWTTSDINASDFGVAISAHGSGFSTNFTSYYIKATNFSFDIPTGATIDGITVEVNKAISSDLFPAILAAINHVRVTVTYTEAVAPAATGSGARIKGTQMRIQGKVKIH